MHFKLLMEDIFALYIYHLKQSVKKEQSERKS